MLKIINSMLRDFYGIEITCKNTYQLQFNKNGKLFIIENNNIEQNIENNIKNSNIEQNKLITKPLINCNFNY